MSHDSTPQGSIGVYGTLRGAFTRCGFGFRRAEVIINIIILIIIIIISIMMIVVAAAVIIVIVVLLLFFCSSCPLPPDRQEQQKQLVRDRQICREERIKKEKIRNEVRV